MNCKAILMVIFLMLLAIGTNARLPGKKHVSGKNHPHSKRVYSMDELVKNLNYGFAKTAVSADEDDRLDQLAETVIEKKYAIALRGYADAIGTLKGNWIVSQKRCNAIKDYLIKKGVPARLIISTAFGSAQPLASNKTAAGRRQNRRVEIKLQPIDS